MNEEATHRRIHFPEPVERDIEAPGGRLHYLDWGGAGVPAHLLHANGFCAGTYTPFVRHLMGDFHVHASDIRGHGRSEPAAVGRIRHWKIFADDLQHVVSAAMSPPVVGMGHSLGAVTTLMAAAAAPSLFRALVLIDPVILPQHRLWQIGVLRLLGLSGRFPLARGARRRKRTFKNRMEAFRRFASGRGLFKTWAPEFIDAYLECGLLETDGESALLRCDPEIEAQIFESVPLDVWAWTRRVRCPVLAIRGEFSDTFGQSAARRLERVMADCRIATVAGAGHFIPMEQPEACAEEIITFVRSLPDNGGGKT